MNLRNTGRLVVAGLAVASALAITACSDDSSSPTIHPTTSAQAAQVPVPTVAVLNAELQRVLDPGVPNAQKFGYVQGMSADPQLADKLMNLYKQNNVQVTIDSVNPRGGNTAVANVTLTVNGKVQPADQTPPVNLVYEDGKWKLTKEWVCQALQLAQITSAACPSTPTS